MRLGASAYQRCNSTGSGDDAPINDYISAGPQRTELLDNRFHHDKFESHLARGAGWRSVGIQFVRYSGTVAVTCFE